MKKVEEIVLDVDFIGNQDSPLTVEERQEITEFIAQWKEKHKKKTLKIKKSK